MTAPRASESATLVEGRLVRVGRAADIPLLEGRSVQVGERRIAVFHLPEGFYACDNACPHAGGPLADGLVGDGCVTCPLHNWRIDLRSGRVTAGGEGSVRTYRVRDQDGELLLEL
ncbi:nitrite reductase small subunit NirD [Thermoleophilum album]|uniref:Nitrite reductase (NADH) small subunit n=1 Tax=Thermoleophilum album TaxID=29539 RepID=A0A1H6FSU5_THEAL|nr:nitrite reductase small subunit NirD [Thermoleophilum album]SEH12835.1 nitrite reductase (NADH) small subunit [Thermoleophilum album]